jgi:oligoribonuclease (3'-5' exoribonuclease)
MTDYPTRMLWLDVETTGLHPPADGLLLEVGAIITDTRGVVVADGRNWLVRLDHKWTLQDVRQVFQPEAWEMHERSGLLTELIRGDGEDVSVVASQLAGWLSQHRTGTDEGPNYILAGNGVDHMDRPWLRHYMPTILGWCTYWSIDPSVIRRSRELWGLTVPPRATVEHRALADAQQALAEWLQLREHFDVLPPKPEPLRACTDDDCPRPEVHPEHSDSLAGIGLLSTPGYTEGHPDAG